MTNSTEPANILEQYITSIPSPQNALDIFKGDWSSILPQELGNLQAGASALFDDARIHWIAEQWGGLEGRAVLELGPLEAGHTYMLERYGAASVLAIEANTRAYLKCLVVKELLNLQRSQFVCGDFIEFLRRNPPRFDICIASGVLYHMRNPVELIELISKVSNRVLIWTHYYDSSLLEDARFTAHTEAEHAGFKHTLHKHEYQAALGWSGFCGGSAPYCNWLSREDILQSLKHFGFSDIQINFDDTNHPNGPAFAIAAAKANRRKPAGITDNLQSRYRERSVEQIELRLRDAQGRIAAMESSKFWKLRKFWFNLKRFFNLPTDE
jgi:predicted nicotinamide N-methyase